MRQASRWRLSASSSPASSERSQESESRREASRQLRSSSALMGRGVSEPARLEAAAERDAGAMQDHPAVRGGDPLGLADLRRLLAQDLAPEEHTACGGGQLGQAALEGIPEAPLVEGRLGVVPGLRRAAPMAGFVEDIVEPRIAIGRRRLFADVGARAFLHCAPLQVDDLEAQDRRKPRSQRRAAVERTDALERGEESLLDGLLGLLGIAQLREGIPHQVGAVALDLQVARVGGGRSRHPRTIPPPETQAPDFISSFRNQSTWALSSLPIFFLSAFSKVFSTIFISSALLTMPSLSESHIFTNLSASVESPAKATGAAIRAT